MGLLCKFPLFFLAVFFFSFLYSKTVNFAVFNDDMVSYEKSSDDTHYKNQRMLAFEILKKELQKQYPKFKIRFKYFFYDLADSRAKLKRTLEVLQSDKSIDVVLGPFNNDIFFSPTLINNIHNGDLPFLSFVHLSGLRSVNNYYTPFEWSDTRFKTLLNYLKDKKILKDNIKTLKMGVFSHANDSLSRDSYEVAYKILGKKNVFEQTLFHNKSDIDFSLDYTKGLDKKITAMLNYHPEIIMLSNNNQISSDIISRVVKGGYENTFISLGTWGCVDTSKLIFQDIFQKTPASLKATGYSVYQLACPQHMLSDEKSFFARIIEEDGRYYLETGVLYKTLKHILDIIFQSPLPISRKNIHKIIQNNSYFKGFSGTHFNLYKTKDHPEFIRIYKFNFQKEFSIEEVTNSNKLINAKKTLNKRSIKKKDF